jgi:hypothetical protein
LVTTDQAGVIAGVEEAFGKVLPMMTRSDDDEGPN